MKILVLSFYFRPDLSACSFRTTSLVTALGRLAPRGSQVDVITSLPNRYHSFPADALETENDANISIYRIGLPVHKSGLLDQSRAFLSFARGAIRKSAGRRYDVVFATSSRLMTAVLGAWIAWQQGAKLYLDIRDIFVDTIQDVLSHKVTWGVIPLLSMLERWAVRRAHKINLVSPGFSEYFCARYPGRQFSYYTNGIDEEFIMLSTGALSQTATSQPLTVVYAGNIGEGQGLHVIIPALAKTLGPRINFKIIGDGGRKAALEEGVRASGVTNVQMLPPLGRAALLHEYLKADVLFLHLNDYDAFKKVLPSKIFEYAALGKPVWAGVAGYAAEFISTEIDNSGVFRPCDVEGAVLSFDRLRIHVTPRREFIAKYARTLISQALARDILLLGGER